MYQDLFISAFSMLKDPMLFEVLTTFDPAYFTDIMQSVQQMFTEHQNSESFHLL